MNLLLLAVLLLSNREHQDIVNYEYSGNDGCSFTVNLSQPFFRSYEDRWYPVIHGMGVSFVQDEYVQPSITCFIPIPPGCEPEMVCIPSGSQSVSPPGPYLVTPIMTGNGFDTEWEIPSTIPSVESRGYAELHTMRLAGTTVAAVTVNPFGGGISSDIPLEISVRLTWPAAAGSRRISSQLLAAVFHSDLLLWPIVDRTDASSPFWGRPWARMAVSATGIHAVTGLELEQAGCEITGTPSTALRVFSGPGTQYVLEDPADEHMLSELAIEVCDGGDGVFNQSDTLKFFAQALDRFDISTGQLQRISHRYATHNVYWLTWGGESGLRIDTVSAMPDASPEWGDSLLHCIWQEQEYVWVAGPDKRTGWAWTQLFETIPSYFYFSTLSADGTGSLTVSLLPAGSGTHRIVLDLRGTVIKDTTWTGSQEFVLVMNDLELDPSMNLLKTTAVEEPGVLYFNYFMIEYPRMLSYAANRMLRFPGSFSRRYNFTFGGAISEFGLLDLTDPAVPVRLEGLLSGTDLDVALDLQHNSQFWLSAGCGSYLSPDSISVSEPGRIIGSGIEGDVAVIVADRLIAAAEPIIAIYADRGLSVVLVSAGEVYDEFGQGLRDPGAIRSFFRYTQDSWSEPPLSLLLIGDGSYDPLMHITAYPTLIPACILLIGKDGINYDDIFVIAHEDGVFPEAPISRIPASSEDDLAAYLSKVMIYESQDGSGDWENRIVLTADDEWGKYNSTNEYQHTASCELLADSILPASLDRIKFYLIEYPWPPGTSTSGVHPEKPDAREDFIQELSAGCANMIFFGHGSYGQLAHEKLLVSSDAQIIENGSKQPVMIFASCDLGHFDMISANCLAEDFVLKPGSGSIVSIGATRGTFTGSNEALFSHYYEETYGGGNPSIAEALWLAKLQTSSLGNSKNYVLLGDGGIHSVYPPAIGCSFEVPADTLRRGMINTVTGSFLNSSIGFLKITESGSERVYNGIDTVLIPYLRYGSSVYQALITGTDQEFSASFFMPMQADTGSYSRGSAVGVSGYGCEVAFDEWITFVDDGNHSTDSIPPSIELWIDGYRGENVPSVSGNAVLRSLLSDSSGICIMGGGAGRSILLSLDSQGFDISRYFTYRNNSYTCGDITYSLPELIEGDHRIILVVWDGMGNTARDTLDFKVTGAVEDLLSSVFVFPNPGEGQRCFNFETSYAGTAVITVYTVAGRSIWRETVSCNEGYNQVIWSGLDMDFDEPGSGAYIYRIDFSTSGGVSSSFTDIMAIVREP